MSKHDSYTVTIHPGVAELLLDCTARITEYNNAEFDGRCENYEDVARHRGRVAAMQDSFIRTIVALLNSTDYDGDKQVTVYGEHQPLSFFFTCDKSGYHGGAIFHPEYNGGKPDALDGRWQIHT